MIKNDDLRTSPKQRLIIIVIAIFMLISTFALYAGIVLNYSGSSSTSSLTSEEQARYDELMAEYNDKVAAQTKELSDKYFETFKTYKSKVKSFNAASVTDIKTEDLKVGTGKTIEEDSTDYSAYYIGWLSNEKVFDSSFDDFNNPTSLKAPLSGENSLIEGWTRGIVGMKIGGVRLISIPSALAYGEEGQGDEIPANSPLKFIIMAIETPESIQPSDELTQLYYKSIGVDLSTDTEEETTETEETETSEE